MDLGGAWRATESSEDLRRDAPFAEFDDSNWPEVRVPGHWRSNEEFSESDGPLLYRRRFTAGAAGLGRRAFLAFDGIFYLGDVWLDGEYLGNTEGYFFPHVFEVTDALARDGEHVVTVEVACSPQHDLRSKRNLTGVFQHSDCIDPAWNPGGIWAPVRLLETGPVRFAALKVLCREASPERAVLELEATLSSDSPRRVRLTTNVAREAGQPVTGDEQEQALASGETVVRWRVGVERPDLWWPRALGAQPLYTVAVAVLTEDGMSDQREIVTGLRRVRVRNFVATVNGERIFLKGANYLPTRRALAEATAEDVARDVALATQAGLDLLRVQAHIGRPELYGEADRAGLLIWQDLPLQWGYGNVRRQAAAQARQAVTLLGHHPSIALWCGHNEPLPVEAPPGRGWRVGAGRVLPSWNRTALDGSIRRALERSDRSREVVAHSGVAPHPGGGTDSHLWFGWYRGGIDDLGPALARWPVNARFVGEFGAQSVPESAEWMEPQRWPALDWDGLAAHHCLQTDVMAGRLPPGAHASFDEWRSATQAYQAGLVRHHIEVLRRLKYRPTGGFCVSVLADSQPAITWSLLDHDRVAKAAFWAVTEACEAVIVTVDRLAASYRRGERLALDLHAVSDLRVSITGAHLSLSMSWPGGGRDVWGFEGDIPADSCVLIGRVESAVPTDCPPGAVDLSLSLEWSGGEARNRYRTVVA